jgi:hypothetical protein
LPVSSTALLDPAFVRQTNQVFHEG